MRLASMDFVFLDDAGGLMRSVRKTDPRTDDAKSIDNVSVFINNDSDIYESSAILRTSRWSERNWRRIDCAT